MRMTFQDTLDKNWPIKHEEYLSLGHLEFKFYLKGTIEVFIISVIKINDIYEVTCVEMNNNIIHVVNANRLFVHKLDTKAAKLLYLKE